MARRVRILPRAAAIVALSVVAGCSDRPPTAPGRDLAGTPLLVSDPVPPPATSGMLGRAAPAVAPKVSYVSLPPGSVPGGTSASIRNQATGASITVPVVEGGFDPVVVAASVGDELAIEVSGPAGVLLSTKEKVPPRRSPKVVRVDPPTGKTDVPLNSRITVVFSEPVDPASVTMTTVRLSANGQPVTGAVQVDPSGLTAEFVPQSELAPSTAYELAVTTGIRDSGGDPLESPSTTQFTTGVSSTGSLRVTTATPGPELDPDGYTVEVEAFPGQLSASKPIGVNASITIPATPVGNRAVTLSGVASNCTVAGGPVRWVDVAAGATVAIAFDVTCAPATQLAFVRDGQIYRVNSDGTGVVRLTDGPSDDDPAWSSDGRRLAFVRSRGGSSDIYVMDADGSNVARLTSGYNPAWSPDGTRIAFAALGEGRSLNVYVMSADGDGTGATAVVTSPGWDGQPAWSPDGTGIAFVSDWVAYDFAMDIFVTTLDGARVAQLTDGFWAGVGGRTIQYFQPAWSPDGRKLAVAACVVESCRGGAGGSIAVMNADGSGLTTLTPANGLARPSWSPDGRMIAFSLSRSIAWIRADGSARGLIIADGQSPAWRP